MHSTSCGLSMKRRTTSFIDRYEVELETDALIQIFERRERKENYMNAPDMEVDHHSFHRHEPKDPVEPVSEGDAPPAPIYWRSRDFQEVCVCLAFLIICLIPDLISLAPYQRPIPYQLLGNGDYVRNLTNDQNLKGETIPDWLLIVLAIVLPLIIQFTTGKWWGQKGDAHATICIYFIAFGLTYLTTTLLKAYCGYLRPVFYEICVPDNTYESCTENSSFGRTSFPSGHASSSFTGLTLLSLFFHNRFGYPRIIRQQQMDPVTTMTATIRSKDDPLRYRLVSLLSLAPMGLALFISASRVFDNKHFPADVVGGAVLGASIAYFVHCLWM